MSFMSRMVGDLPLWISLICVARTIKTVYEVIPLLGPKGLKLSRKYRKDFLPIIS